MNHIALFFIVFGFILLMAVIVMLLVAIHLILHDRKGKAVTEKNTAKKAEPTEGRLEKSEVMNRFYDYQMDAFLRRTYPGLRSWHPVHERRIGFHWQGLHVITCYMHNGERFDVSTYVKPDHITPELYKKPEVKKETVSCEELAARWMAKWSPEFAKHAMQAKGFAIPVDDLPKEAEVLDLILEHIAMQGEFSAQFDEDDSCLRFAVASTAAV